ncbi:MAG: hypothetical protein ACD_76C00045G0006 [uncultured bacterium]|nr:MAG: hypothetical protein ACD_76C00045G0006 [uncultured bacterium]HBD05214.1 hypothetical protein [Candidatus Uhrbacteria bacterium]
MKKYNHLLLAVLMVSISIFATGCGGSEEKERTIREAEEEAEAKRKAGVEDSKKPSDDIFLFYEDTTLSEPREIFRVDSLYTVFGGGTPTAFTLDKTYRVTELGTYHWNDGNGSPAQTLQIVSADGKTYGPWQTTIRDRYYWIATIDIELPPGSYTVIDSEPATWAQNEETKGMGIAWMFGAEVINGNE